MLTVALRENLFAYYVRNKFGYNVVTARITIPTFIALRAENRSPGHKRPHAQTDC